MVVVDGAALLSIGAIAASARSRCGGSALFSGGVSCLKFCEPSGSSGVDGIHADAAEFVVEVGLGKGNVADGFDGGTLMEDALALEVDLVQEPDGEVGLFLRDVVVK